MKRKLLLCLVTICALMLTLPLFSICASAADATSAAVVTTAQGDELACSTLADALQLACQNTGSTVKILADQAAPELTSNGTYTLDLNGCTLTLSAPLSLSGGTLTVKDSNKAAPGKIAAADTAAVKLAGGSMMLSGKCTVCTTNADYVIVNEGEGVLYLCGKPTVGGAIYLQNPDTLYGNDGAEKFPLAYSGEAVSVHCAFDAQEGAVAVKGGSAEHFDVAHKGLYNVVEKDGDLVISKWGYLGWIIIAALAIGALILLALTVRHSEKVDKKIKKLNSFVLPVAIPAFLPIMSYMTELEKLLLLLAAGFFLMAVFYAIISFPVANKKLKKALAAAQNKPCEKAPDAPIEAAEQAAPAEVAAEDTAPAEDAPAQDAAPAEDTAPAEDAPAEENPPKEYAPLEANVPVVSAEGKTLAYSTYRRSFLARIIASSADVQARYDELKNALLSYKKVASRVSWSYESIKAGRKQLAKFAICGKTLCLFLAIDPTTLSDSKYNVANMGGSKKYEAVPCRLRLTSKRSVKWGLELIAKMAENEQLELNPKYKAVSYIPANEPDEVLLEKGLIKKVQ